MYRIKRYSLKLEAAAAFCLMSGGAMAQPVELSPIEMLGKQVFFDTSLSIPGNKQGCVSCHDPRFGWTFPDSEVNAHQVVAPGASPRATGLVKPPTIAYAAFAPVFNPCGLGGTSGHCGGLFNDGRAEGWGALYPTQQLPLGDGLVTDTVTEDDLPVDKRADYKQYLGPLADQAINPFQKGPEQNAGEKHVCQQVKTAKYKGLYQEVFGEKIDCRTEPADNPPYHTSFKRIVVAIAAYEKSAEVNSFTSRRDVALRKELACLDEADLNTRYPGENVAAVVAPYYNATFCAQLKSQKASSAEWGKFPLVDLTDLENKGHDLFYDVPSELNPQEPLIGEDGEPILDNRGRPILGGNSGCHRCHNDNPGIDDGTELFQTYSDKAYHNIGIPYNREIPNVAYQEVSGVADHLSSFIRVRRGITTVNTTQLGFYKNPTLRELDQGAGPDFVKAFGHNGYFKSLEGIVHFYNTRDVLPACEEVIPGITHPTEAEALANNCWPAPEFPAGATTFGNVGNLHLDEDGEAAIVAYLRTLTDTHVAKAP